MTVGRIAGLWRYPVKSMGGEELEAVPLTATGIPGDRGWAVYDEERSGVTSAKRLPAIRACRARYSKPPAADEAPPPAEVMLPDGSSFLAGGTEASRALTAFFGRPVSLRGLGAPGTEAAARVAAEGDPEADRRAILGVEPGDVMPDLSAFAPEVMQPLRRASFFDAFPLHLLTSATIATLQALGPESRWDVRRFRPNVLVETAAAAGFPEIGWIGRRLRLGGAVIEVVAGCPRCVMVSQPVDGLARDPRVLRTIVRGAEHVAGVYARIVEPGELYLDDRLERL